MKTEKLIAEFRKWFGFKEGKKFRFARGGTVVFEEVEQWLVDALESVRKDVLSKVDLSEAKIMEMLDETRRETLGEVEKNFEVMHKNMHGMLRDECNPDHCNSFIELDRAKRIIAISKLSELKEKKEEHDE